MNSKPPIGITPRWLLDEERKKEINNAIKRYNNAGYSIPIEWYQELNEIENRLLEEKRKETKMDCKYCGYCWADVDEDGTPISIECCHFDGPDGWAPCEQDDVDEYANEAYIEEEAAREEAEYEDWLDSLPEELCPTNAHEYVESWKRFCDRFEEPTFEEYGAPYDYQEF